MNTEKTMKLLSALGEIRGELVEEAGKKAGLRRPSPAVLGAMAAGLCLLVGLGFYLAGELGLPTPLGSSSGGSTGGGGAAVLSDHYMSYAGPVFPLTAAEDAGDITAERRVTFDFSGYGDLLERDRKISVTDSYRLTNPGGEARTLELFYPYALDLQEETSPAVTVAGAPAATELLFGPITNARGNLLDLGSWGGYKSLMGEDYLLRALAEPLSLDVPVTVYELKDRWAEHSEEAPAPTLELAFTLDREKTAVLTYGFNGGSDDFETGDCRRHSSVPRPGNAGDGESVYLLVLGEDIGEYTLRGYTDGSCTLPLSEAGGTVLRYESTLGEMIPRLLDSMSELMAPIPTAVFSQAEDVVSEWLEMLGLLDGDYGRFWPLGYWSVEDAFGHLRDARVLYARFTVTVPAGGSLDIGVTTVKHCSKDFGVGKNADRDGYDLVTTLGSNLCFTKQEAALLGGEDISFLRQDFGFDPASGVTLVTLDSAKEHYAMDVEKAD